MIVFRTCPNEDCSNNGAQFDADNENLYCPKCGSQLVDDLKEEA